MQFALRGEMKQVMSPSASLAITVDHTQKSSVLAFERRDGTIQCCEIDRQHYYDLLDRPVNEQYSQGILYEVRNAVESDQKVSQLLDTLRREESRQKDDASSSNDNDIEDDERELNHLTSIFLNAQGAAAAGKASSPIQRVKTERGGWKFVKMELPATATASPATVPANVSLHVCLTKKEQPSTATFNNVELPSIQVGNSGATRMFGGIAISSSRCRASTTTEPCEIALPSNDGNTKVSAVYSSMSASFRQSRRAIQKPDGNVGTVDDNAVCLCSTNSFEPLGVVQVHAMCDWKET
jgi:hypothetical protein